MVKCSECGFLCHRSGSHSELQELSLAGREDGSLPATLTRGTIPRAYTNQLVCFVQAESFTELGDAGSVVDIIQRDRDCSKFTQWRQGFSPKEHFQMLQQNDMLRWQADQAEANRKHNMQSARIQGGATIAAVFIAYMLSPKSPTNPPAFQPNVTVVVPAEAIQRAK